MNRSVAEKLTLFARHFSGLDHAYGTYDPVTGRPWQVKAKVTAEVMLAHLLGRRPYGVFLLTGTTARAVVADFDHEDRKNPAAFCRLAAQYGIPAYVERSKRKGWHIWSFAGPQGVRADKARLMFKRILTDLDCRKVEVFPKRDKLDGPSDYGNFINAPLFGKLVPEGRTVFVDPENDFRPYADQWDFLAGVRCLAETQLDELIALHLPILDQSPQATVASEWLREPKAAGNADAVMKRVFGLPPCAQRMLREGVTENQRVSCFRLAVALCKTALPEDSAVVVLLAWAPKNRPEAGKRIITPAEIKDITHRAYMRKYAGCGCETPAVAPFCSPQCHLFQDRDALGTHSVHAALGTAGAVLNSVSS